MNITHNIAGSQSRDRLFAMFSSTDIIYSQLGRERRDVDGGRRWTVVGGRPGLNGPVACLTVSVINDYM